MIKTVFITLIIGITNIFTIPMMSVTAQNNNDSEALYVVYPDYPVNTDSWNGDTTLVGHAGVLLIKNDGLTKYYEYGRYDDAQIGQVKNRTVPNVTIGSNGFATVNSLAEVLKKLSEVSGREGRIRAAYFINLNFNMMNNFAISKVNESNPSHADYNEQRTNYNITDYNCSHFAEKVITQNPKVDKPTILNPTPNNFVDEYIEEGNAEINYNPDNNTITIGEGDESDAKIQ